MSLSHIFEPRPSPLIAEVVGTNIDLKRIN